MPNERNFILQSFGLQYLKAAIYPPGRQLDSGNTDMDSVAKKEIADLDYSMTTLEGGKAPLSMLGTPVFADLILQSNEKGADKMQFLWTLLEVNMQKNIVKTAVQGRNGTVKEYVSDGDYQVTIRGGLFSPFSAAYPKDDMTSLMALLQKNTPLTVISEYLAQFKINSLVVEDYSFAQKEGVQNVQLFEIKTVSDEPIQLKQKL